MPRPPLYPFARPAGRELPTELQQLAGRAPTRVELHDGTLAFLVTSDQGARDVLCNRAFSADATRPGYPVMSPGRAALTSRPTFLRQDAPEHDTLRRMVLPYFTARHIRALEPRLAATARKLTDAIAGAGSPADFVAGFAVPFPGRTIETLLGLRSDERIRSLTAALNTHAVDGPAKEQAATDLLAHLDDVVTEQSHNPRPGIIGDLVRNHLLTGKVTAQQIADTIRLLLTAGQETSAGMLALTLLDLAEDPRWRDQLTGPQPVAEAAIEELLRWHCVVHTGITRVAVENTAVQGVAIPAGTGVIISVLAANHDPTRYAKPDQMQPGRDNGASHLAFGRGIHQCLGQSLARAQLRIGLAAVADRFPGLHLIDKPLRFTPQNGIFSLETLPLAW
ncbi:cytochrome P450 [Phytohabitans aurantiacus]|nr:cytochrome P450 [Phytohabitans aurantiacus]